MVPVANASTIAPGIAALLIHLAILGIAVYLLFRLPLVTLGIAWIYVALIPFSEIAPNMPFYQERYGSLALGGFAVLVGLGFNWLLTSERPARTRRIAAITAIFLLGFLSFTTVSRVSLYKDDLTLWKATAKRAPEHAGAHNNLGAALMARNQYKSALAHFKKATELDPSFGLSRKNIAECHVRLGQYSQAQEAYDHYLQLAPYDKKAAESAYRIRILNGQAGQVIEALKRHAEGENIHPPFLFVLALAYQAANENQKAKQTLEQYMKIVPDDPQAIALQRLIQSAQN